MVDYVPYVLKDGKLVDAPKAKTFPSCVSDACGAPPAPTISIPTGACCPPTTCVPSVPAGPSNDLAYYVFGVGRDGLVPATTLVTGSSGYYLAGDGTWQLASAFAAGVTSVNGRTGVVSLTKADVGLSIVENVALSSWAGSGAITQLGNILTGNWSGTPIADAKIASASTWNAKEPSITAGTTLQYWRGDKTWQTFPTTWAWGSITSTPTSLSGYGITDGINVVTNDTNLTGTVVGHNLTLGWTGTLADARIASAATWNAKEPSITAGTTLQYWRGDKTWQTFPTTWAWGSITSTPTSLSGYGITDGVNAITNDTNLTGTVVGHNLTLGWTGTLADARIASAATWNAKESALGNPGTNGWILSSTTGGTRSWIAPPSGAAWGSITGTLSSQTDLNTALSGKVSTATTVAGTALSGNITQDQITGLASTGLVKRTAANTLAIAVAGTDYQAAGSYQPLATNLTSLAGLTYALTSFVKMTAAGTFALDTAAYLTANQTITLSGDVSGSGTTAITTAIGAGKVTNAMLAGSIDVTTKLTGVLLAAQHPALTGDITNTAGTLATTLATVNANVGSFGSATAAPTFTVNGKGLITAAGSVTVTPAVGSITGLGTSVATALAIAVGSAGALVTNGGALGTPSSGNLANCTFPTLNQSTTGSAASLTTSRNIGGSAFNGTVDVTSFPSPGAIGGTTPSSVAATVLNQSANTNGISRGITSRNLSAGSSAYSIFDLGNDTSSALLEFNVTSSTNTGYGGVNSANIYTGGAYVLWIGTNGGAAIKIDTSNGVTLTNGLAVTGAVTATGNITAYFSDDRLKTRDGKIENALKKVASLDGFYFYPNDVAGSLGYDTSKRAVGVSAQSVEKIFPEMIEPAPIDPQYKTLDYSRLAPLFVEAFKEVIAHMKAQDKRIAELEAR